MELPFEAGRDGFWLARWLRTRDIEAHVVYASSVAVSRERGAQDRPSRLLKRALSRLIRGFKSTRNILRNNALVNLDTRQHEALTVLDGWIKAQNAVLSRPEAIRKLMERALYAPTPTA